MPRVEPQRNVGVYGRGRNVVENVGGGESDENNGFEATYNQLDR